MNVVIAAGGTAGHVNPAVALARALTDCTISFIGTTDGLEARVVPAAGFELDPIAIQGFDRAKPLRLPLVGAKAVGAIGAARKLLKTRAADVVVGMGGYVSLPVALAAKTSGIPVVLHEQNIVLGLANKVAKPFARRIGVSFEDTLHSAGPRAVFTGNPILPEIAHFDRAVSRGAGYAHFGLDPALRTVLVFGGSLGARTLNVAAPQLAARWAGRSDIQVLHISGRSSADRSGDEPPPSPNYHRVEYTDAMAEVYAVADIGVCRGGATTVAELCAVGLPSVIVPYPYHRDRQQERHARVLESAGAAEVVLDAHATAETLAGAVERLVDEGRLPAMAAAAAGLGRPDAAQRMAELVRGVA
jgi:UDP-N-acetylglucosamine--N-acetylmuramyl-(pentapeptide) pyrophosphoryl-undecaprenol N-acetylglucosamine transferase